MKKRSTVRCVAVAHLAAFLPKGKFLVQLKRKLPLLVRFVTLKKIVNVVSLGFAYIRGKNYLKALPPIIKVELSAVCNLACTVCVHADRPDLKDQSF
ncbi:unnamed protein product, partial [marine sediment metagenome]